MVLAELRRKEWVPDDPSPLMKRPGYDVKLSENKLAKGDENEQR